MLNLQEYFWNCITLNWHSCVVLNKQYIYFSMTFLKYPLNIKWFLPTRWYIIFSVLVYSTSHIKFSNQNLKSFTIKTLIFLAEMKLGWLDISWWFTETCGCETFFSLLYPLQNSLLLLPISNLTKMLNIFMIIGHGKGAMYFSRIFLLVWEFFAWQILIMKEWTEFITTREWPSSAMGK